MFENDFFDRNLLAVSERQPELSHRLRAAEKKHSRYKFQESRSGDIIPSLLDSAGIVHPLHSMMDPRKEARRLISTVENESFLILLGLGGGYYVEAALERDDIGMVLVVEYGLNGLCELFCKIDYTRFFRDARFHLLADAPETELEKTILDLYKPVLYGGVRAIPMRSRTDREPKPFNMAGEAIQAAVKRVSADYSVQVHFGRRWFSNIARNIKAAETADNNLPQVYHAAVTAAGPSLSTQIPCLRKKRKERFVIATDTSLPCLLQENLIPDAVISIDCQHISYHHFMNGLPGEVLLFLDLASPPLLSTLSKRHQFFSTGHPFTRYISRTWKEFPELDVSGGNVTYAAMSLAEKLGARKIELYGADFAYPGGVSYARGAYIYSVFGKSQNRFSPLEAQSSAFLYRTPLSKKSLANKSWYYETATLKFYRERLEEKSKKTDAAIIPAPGLGAPINVELKTGGLLQSGNSGKTISDNAVMKAEDFLGFFLEGITRLPKPGKNPADYIASLKDDERALFASILPLAASLKQRKGGDSLAGLLDEVKAYCLSQISLRH